MSIELNFEKTTETINLVFEKTIQQLVTSEDIDKIKSLKLDARLLMDKSLSMAEEFECGWVSQTIDLFIASASKFDDDGQLRIGFFNSQFEEAPTATKDDFGSYLKNNPITPSNGTCFVPAISGILTEPVKNKIFGFFKRKTAVHPIYLTMVTDGDCGDQIYFEMACNDLPKNVFLQVIAIGDQVNLKNLKFLNNLLNTSFFHIEDPHSYNTEQFMEKLFNINFITWAKNL